MKKDVKLKPISHKTTVTRNDGIEKITTDQNFIIQAEDESFILLYKKLSSVAANVSVASMSVFIEICFKMRMGENSFVSNGQLWHDIAKNLGISVGTVRNSFTELKKEGLIHGDKTFKRTYYVNPLYAWYGSQLNKAKIISIILEQTSVNSDTKITAKGRMITMTRTEEQLNKSFTDEDKM